MSAIERNQVRQRPDGTALAWHRPETEDDDAQPWLVIAEVPMYGVDHTWHPDEDVADWTVLARIPQESTTTTPPRHGRRESW